jgi:hypothetical protein
MRGSILIGLVVIGTLLPCAYDARAASLGPPPPPPPTGDIKISGGIIQNGDPSYTYQLLIEASNGAVTIDSGSTFTLNGLVGVDSGSVFNPPNDGNPWNIDVESDGTLTEGSVTYDVSDVTWTLASGTLQATDGELALLTVTTNTEYSESLPGGYPTYLTDGVSYADSVSGSANNTGQSGSSLMLQQGGVPEPSTMTYALCAVGALPVVHFVRRRRPRAQGPRTP